MFSFISIKNLKLLGHLFFLKHKIKRSDYVTIFENVNNVLFYTWFYNITYTKKKPTKEQYTSQLGTKKLFEIRYMLNNKFPQ